MQSVLDLRRLEFRKEALNIDTFDNRDLQVWTNDWDVLARPLTAEQALNAAFALRAMAMRNSACCADLFGWRREGPRIYRFLRGAEEQEKRASQADYLISWRPYWMHAAVFSRPPRNSFYVRNVDDFLLSFRLLEEPRLDAEVLPAWKEYQARRRPGMAWAKFVLSNDGPVRLGEHTAFVTGVPTFTPDDYGPFGKKCYIGVTDLPGKNGVFQLGALHFFPNGPYEQGGRQIASNLIEFYPPTNAISLRVDVWVDEDRTQERAGNLVFRARLDVTGPQLDIWTFNEPYPMNVPSGQYDMEVRLLNEGTHDDERSHDRERFDRDDLERCEVSLTRAVAGIR